MSGEVVFTATEGRVLFLKVQRSYGPRFEWNARDKETGVYIEHAANKTEARKRILAEIKAFEEL